MKKILTLLLVAGVVMAGACFAADDLTVTDPLYIGVGARPLGMGKAYVAVAEDADGMFINPATLGRINGPKVTSMYSSVLGDVNYMVLGGAYPHTKNSAFGAGIVRSSVDGIDLYAADGSRISTPGSWGNSVMFVSYGINLEDAKLSLGGSAKYFSQGGSGTATIESASASGMGFDVGAVYTANENLSLGMVAQNVTGTKLESGNNVENSMLSTLKAGVKYSIKPLENQKLTLAVDADMTKKRPVAYHAGVEYYPIPNIALRIGMDQDPAPGGVESNLTAGVGLRFSGMEFNYAYHPYTQIADNATHYFSVAYVGPEKEEMASLDLSLLKPTDKSIIYADNVEVTGSVKDKSINLVKVNGISVPVTEGQFTASAPVDKLGKKLIVVEAKNAKGQTARDTRRILRLVHFTDVGEGFWAKKPIEHTGTVGLVQGYPDGTFKPERALTRAELATLLVRAKGVTPYGKPKQVFKDVKANHWAAGYIEAAQRLGMVQGYPDKKFRPNNKINKAETVAVVVRFDKLALNPVENKPYTDVGVKHWAAKYIQAAKEAGMLSYIEGVRLRPKEEVNRAESVEMLSHTGMASKMINELLAWDKGFEYEISKPALKASL